MSQFPHDQFAKNLLESLLTNFGRVQTALTINSEVREIDVYFTPNSNNLPHRELGLLAKCIRHSAVFEPFRNPVTNHQIRSCMAKLYDLHGDLLRQNKRQEEIKLDETNLPRLWILTPTLAIPTLESFGATIDLEEWGEGVYLFSSAQKTGIIVLHQLPKTSETLWLRLLGKGKVQTEAIAEVAAMSADNVYRGNALELFGNLLVVLEKKKKIEAEERNLIMQLSPLYLEKIQAAEARGTQQGIQQGMQQGIQQGRQVGELAIVMKQLQRCFGNLSEEIREKIAGLSVERLEVLAEELLDFATVEDLENWLAS